MRRVALALIASLGADVAQAGEKPELGPPAAWVTPTEGPKALPKDDGAAIRVLVLDSQVRFDDAGRSTYVETMTRIQSVEGLGSVGTISMSWKPDTGSLTVHKVRILRGDKVIDVLANQTFTVLRRENNLELAMLDGVLTATLQPEGLQVGDILDVASTRTDREPVLGGRVDATLAGPTQVTVDRVRLRAQWPASKVIRSRFTEGFIPTKPTRAGGITTLEVDAMDLQPLHGPVGAPPRFSRLREIELSEFQSWAEVSALLEPLYAKASALERGSAIQAEAARIRAASKDPKAWALQALTLVQNQVRYVYLGMNDGGLVPSTAEATWKRRFGDCKAKTALLLALLRELDVQAEPVLVSTSLGDGLDERLPNVGVFDHILVRASIGGRNYWLDGTRTGDLDLDRIKVPPFVWALPLKSAGATLVRLERPPLTVPDTLISLKFDASRGLDVPAATHAEAVMNGDAGSGMNVVMANFAATDRDAVLRRFWKSTVPGIEPKTVSASYNSATGEETLMVDGETKLDWKPWSLDSRWYEVKSASLGWKPDFSRESGPNVDAPFAVDHPTYAKAIETVILPWGGAGFTVKGDDVDARLAGYALRRTTRIEKGVFTLETTTRTLSDEFPAKEAPAAAEALEAMANVSVWLASPAHYIATADDMAALTATQPKTSEEFVTRGSRFSNKGEFEKAIADFDRAVALDPKASLPYADRGIAHYWLGEYALAKADFDKASELDSRSLVAVHGQGLLAMHYGRYADAVALFTRATDLLRDDDFALYQRALAYNSIGQDDKALADTDAILKIRADNSDALWLRATIFRSRKQFDQALAELDKGLAANPDDIILQLRRVTTLAMAGRLGEAREQISAYIAAKPTAATLLVRAGYRDKADLPGRLADIGEALKLEPKNTSALRMKALAQVEAGDAAGAIDTLTHGLKDRPGNLDLLMGRAETYVKIGKPDLALKDFEQVRVQAETNGKASQLNSLCWTQATLGFALEAARRDCEAGIKITRNFAIVDSHAFVLLRLGLFDEAAAEYDAALAMHPGGAASLYGRGIAKLRLGKAGDGQADLASARGLSAQVEEEFAGYGVKP